MPAAVSHRRGPPAHAFDAGLAAVHREAIEQAIFWAAHGVTPAMAMEALGVSWRSERGPGWYDVQLALSHALRTLRAPKLAVVA